MWRTLLLLLYFAITILVIILQVFTNKEVHGSVNYEYYILDNNTAWNVLPNKNRYYDYNFLNGNFYNRTTNPKLRRKA